MKGASLHSWGRYPRVEQESTECHWRDELPTALGDSAARQGTTLPFGNGRSYGDSCLAASGRVIDMRPLDRFMSANWDTGVLVAESGLTFQEILSQAIPRGWFLPVTPGTKHVTLGGAIANDVHGKNHHRSGTLGLHVRRFGLLRSDIGRVTCSAGERPDLFAATIGGLGLTGVIEWAEIQLARVRSSRLAGVKQRFGNLGEFFDLSAELDERHEYCVAWIDCLTRGKALVRGIYTAADFADDARFEVDERRKIAVPLTPPFPVANRLTLPLFNAAYWRAAPARRARIVTNYEPFFYPLDGIAGWNRLYGPAGFQQYQVVIPERNAREAIHALLDAIASASDGSFLAVLKRCGKLASPGLMSFPCEGTSLALDFPQTRQLVTELFPRLDAIVREAGGRHYPAKDAHMSGEDFRRSYPAWETVEKLRDPVLLSRFWSRVTQ